MRAGWILWAWVIGVSHLLALAACESEAPNRLDGPSADAPSTFDAGPVDGSCAIVAFDGQLAAPSCPLTVPGPPGPCPTGTTCQYITEASGSTWQTIAYCPAGRWALRGSVCEPYCGTPSDSATAVNGTACGERPLQACPTAMPGMTRYDHLVMSLEEIATACALPSPGSGGGVRVWFEGGCATRVEATRSGQPLDGVRDCLADKLRIVRVPCAQEFACASVSHALD
jgi:hypothetical protein